MILVYVDKLSFYSLAALIWSRRKYDRLFYFDATRGARAQAAVLRRLGLLKATPEIVDFFLGDVRDNTGGSAYVKILGEKYEIGQRVKEAELANNRLLREFGQHFDFQKLLLYFADIVANDVEHAITFLNVAGWHAKKYGADIVTVPVMLLEKSPWRDYLHSHALDMGLELVDYSTVIRGRYLKHLARLGRLARSAIKRIRISLAVKFRGAMTKKGQRRQPELRLRQKGSAPGGKRAPRVSAVFITKSAMFEKAKRSGIFWLLKAGISFDRVLLYFSRADKPATSQMAAAMEESGLGAVALMPTATLSDSVPVWRSGKASKAIRQRWAGRLTRLYAAGLWKRRRVPLFYFMYLYKFIARYAYWTDFFISHDIKVNVNVWDGSRENIPMHLALEHSGGVSISYQLSNGLDFPPYRPIGSADVVFAFGPAYRWQWQAGNSQVGALIYSGYVSDYCFSEIKESSLKLRQRLADAGARFIIAFFDEASADDRMSVISTHQAVETYARFVRLLLEDETVGVIFKPKKPETIYERLSPIADVVDKAKATGRCVFLDSDRDILPCEASQAADLAVGLLLGSTTGLESFLSGTPTVFLDLEQIYCHPIYNSGKGTVVFDTLPSLFNAIAKFRQSPQTASGFGDLSVWIQGRDPFSDGNASQRIGRYIAWLLSQFDQGAARDEALKFANQQYALLWGEDSVVDWPSRNGLHPSFSVEAHRKAGSL